LFIAIGWVLARLPVSWSNALGRGLGRAGSRLNGRRRGIALDNLTRSFPEEDADELLREMYTHLGLMSVELLRTFGGRPPPVTFVGLEHAAAAIEAGRGVIVISGHFGNFELFLHVTDRMPAPTNVLIKPFSFAPAAAALARVRGGGPTYIPAGDGAARESLRVLRKGEFLIYAFDQYAPSGDVVAVPYFGRPAVTSRTLVRLAHRSGAAIIPMFMHRREEDHLVEMCPEVMLSEDTEEGIDRDTARCTAIIEEYVRRDPTQYLWFHRRWKTRPRIRRVDGDYYG
jgi:KDO2-lipid IV(A) lauroyltransferase